MLYLMNACLNSSADKCILISRGFKSIKHVLERILCV